MGSAKVRQCRPSKKVDTSVAILLADAAIINHPGL
jgi:hypothetical protein